MLIFKILIWFVLGLVSLFLIVALIPFNYVFAGRLQETISGKFELRYGFLRAVMARTEQGNNVFRISLFNIALKGDKGGKREKREAKKEDRAVDKKEKKKANWRLISSMLDRDFLGEIIKTAGRILKSCCPKVFQISGVVGFQDPYYTGLLSAVKGVWPDIDIEPDFTREIYDLVFHVEGKIIILTIIYHVIRFLLSSEGRHLLRRIWQEKKREKSATKIKHGVYRTTKAN